MIHNKIVGLMVFCAAASLAQAQQFPSTNPIVPFPENAKVVHGEPDFEKVVRFNEDSQIGQLGQGVAHLILSRASVCSGFLVARDVLMTNHHCVVASGGVRQPSEIEVFMDYYEDGSRGSRTALGQEYLHIDEPLDFALVKLDRPLGDSYPILGLSTSTPRESGNVKVIQHPAGRSKEVSRRNAEIIKIYNRDNVIHYRADTQGGSSGSPVFAVDGNTVIALHHAGSREGGYSEGVLMSSILRSLA